MDYVTSADMKLLYDEALLIQATNYSDAAATTINEERLVGACETGNAITDGWLSLLPIDPSKFNGRFKSIVRLYSARLALDSLEGTSEDPQIREHAKEALEWFKSLPRLSQAALSNLAASTTETVEDSVVLPTQSIDVVDEGQRWYLTFL